jgi:hypothetical protein
MTKNSENPTRLGNQIEVHMQGGCKLNGEPPLSRDERRRRVILLCCGFIRNLAFHRAGLQDKVRDDLLNHHYRPEGEFWIQVHGNFLDACVLDWCKLFADLKGKHHWRRVVDNPDRFETDLRATLEPSAFGFTRILRS